MAWLPFLSTALPAEGRPSYELLWGFQKVDKCTEDGAFTPSRGPCASVSKPLSLGCFEGSPVKPKRHVHLTRSCYPADDPGKTHHLEILPDNMGPAGWQSRGQGAGEEGRAPHQPPDRGTRCRERSVSVLPTLLAAHLDRGLL